MNPSFDKLPSPDSTVPGNGSEVRQQQVQERPHPFPEHVQSVETAPEYGSSATASSSSPLGNSHLPTQGQQVAPPASAVAASAAEDDDAEVTKQYVMKAKAIVEQTANDPYQQSLRIDQLRGDYGKRFGRSRAAKST